MNPLTKPDSISLQFEAAAVSAGNELFLACSNAQERFDDFARLCRYRPGANPPWSSFDLPIVVTDATFFVPGPSAMNQTAAAPAFVFLTKEGDVMYLPPGREANTERIVGSGLWSDDSEGWGYMTSIVAIDGRLHACGDGGQVYRRSDSGLWEHIDEGLLQGKGEDDGIRFEAIAGSNERDVYIGGWHKNVNDGVFHVREQDRSWKAVAHNIPAIAHIHVEREDSVWACGRNGTLLHGNRVDGFKDVSELGDSRAYVSVVSYDGRIFLATETGLYTHANGSARRVRTGLVPEHDDGHILQVVDGVLWSIGYTDIVRFDGTSWERLPFPGNPPIR